MAFKLRFLSLSDDQGIPRTVVLRTFPATIGCHSNSAVRLDDGSLSGEHAVVAFELGTYVIRDCGSLGGTVVGGVRVASGGIRQLSDGDILRIGRYWLQAVLGVAVTNPFLRLFTRISKRRDEGPVHLALGVVEGARRGERLFLSEHAEVFIGKDDEGCIHREAAQASRGHVRVVRRGMQIFVRDDGRRNRCWLGGVRVPEATEVPWKPVTHLRVGRAVLALSGPRPALEELLGSPIESGPSPS